MSGNPSRRAATWLAPALASLVFGAGAAHAQAPGFEVEELDTASAPTQRGSAPHHRAARAPTNALHEEQAPALKLVHKDALLVGISQDGQTTALGGQSSVRVTGPLGDKTLIRAGKRLYHKTLELSADGALLHYRNTDGHMSLYDVASGSALVSERDTWRSRLTPAGELLWWEHNKAVQNAGNGFALFDPNHTPPQDQERPGSCRLTRRAPDGRTQRIWLAECRDLLAVSPDGAYGLIAQGGKVETFSVNQHASPMQMQRFDSFARVDLRSGEREWIGDASLTRVAWDETLSVVCGLPDHLLHSAVRDVVRCVRGGDVIDVRVPANPAGPVNWTWYAPGPGGQWMYLAHKPMSASRSEQTPVNVVSALVPLQANPHPTYQFEGFVQNLDWLSPTQVALFSETTRDTMEARLIDIGEGLVQRLDSPSHPQEMSGAMFVGQDTRRILFSRGRKGQAGADAWILSR